MRKEYDVKSMKGGVTGKYYRRYLEGTHTVLLDPDVAAAFPTAKDVNDALRILVAVASKSVRSTRRRKAR
jgi:hypothetical protein